MVAHQRHHDAPLFQGDHLLDYASAVRASVDVVAQENDGVERRRFDGLDHGSQGRRAAVNVSDGDDASGHRATPRQPSEIMVSFLPMAPLYEAPCFTFSFADNRTIPRFHLEGVEVGRQVSVFKIDPGTGERLALLAMATVGEGGWVDLAEPIIVKAGEAFIVVPGPLSFGVKPAPITRASGR